MLKYANISYSRKKSDTFLSLSSVHNCTEFVSCSKSWFCRKKIPVFLILNAKGKQQEIICKNKFSKKCSINRAQFIYHKTSNILNVCPLSKCSRVQILRFYFPPTSLCNVFHLMHLCLSSGFH